MSVLTRGRVASPGPWQYLKSLKGALLKVVDTFRCNSETRRIAGRIAGYKVLIESWGVFEVCRQAALLAVFRRRIYSLMSPNISKQLFHIYHLTTKM